MTSKPDETTDDPKVEDDAVVLRNQDGDEITGDEEVPTVETGDVAVPKDITEITSYADAKAVVVDGVDKIRNSSAEELKKMGFRAVNRVWGAWRKLVDGD